MPVPANSQLSPVRDELSRGGKRVVQQGQSMLRMLAMLMLMLPAFSCNDESPVSVGPDSQAQLSVNVSLGDIQDADISSVRVVARFTGTNGVVTREVTQPITRGESRTINVPLDLATCQHVGAGATSY